MLFKDKEVLERLSTIERKVDLIISMKKNERLKNASKNSICKGGK